MGYIYYNNVIVMVVKIDFSNLPVHLRNAITNEIGMKKRSGKGRSDGDTDEQVLKRAWEIRIKTRKSI
jgi:hypothetical protein